jgi:hypothetical protein
MKGFRTAMLGLAFTLCSAVWASAASTGIWNNWQGSWSYPGEVSVTATYNGLYGTSYANTPSGLEQLFLDKGLYTVSGNTVQFASPTDIFNTGKAFQLQIAADDTSAVSPITVSGLGIYQPVSWTSPTRGSAPLGTGQTPATQWIDLAGLLGKNAQFSISVGGVVLDGQNTIILKGTTPGEYLIGYNEGGRVGGDRDMNEPLLRAKTATPIPGAVWLLGSGLSGLAVFRRKKQD